MGKERDFSVVFQRCLEAPCVREMTTRGSLARGQGKETFQGRVQVWIKKLSPVGGGQGSQRLTILKWVPTGASSAAGSCFSALSCFAAVQAGAPEGYLLGCQGRSRRRLMVRDIRSLSRYAALSDPGQVLQLVSLLRKQLPSKACLSKVYGRR